MVSNGRLTSKPNPFKNTDIGLSGLLPDNIFQSPELSNLAGLFLLVSTIFFAP
jgi:hypothetical protein